MPLTLEVIEKTITELRFVVDEQLSYTALLQYELRVPGAKRPYVLSGRGLSDGEKSLVRAWLSQKWGDNEVAEPDWRVKPKG